MNNLDALYRLCVLLFISLILFYLYKNSNYKKETYYQVTKHSYISVLFNKGSYGEYLTYKNLKRFEAEGAKFLFNVYIPMRQGKTTEIDVVMISSKGVFVLESKNYSGWIFGDEEQQYWYQTLPMSKWGIHKEKFYNPIKQNNTHIKYLKKILGTYIPVKSIIVFSDRCTLKKLHLNSQDIHVINRCKIVSLISSIFQFTPMDILNESQILEIYNKLYPYTQVDAQVKKLHIENVDNQRSYRETHIVQNRQKWQHDVKKADGNTCLKCPWCNGKLVQRTAKKGEHAGQTFYGCKNYPKCTYIQNIHDTKSV